MASEIALPLRSPDCLGRFNDRTLFEFLLSCEGRVSQERAKQLAMKRYGIMTDIGYDFWLKQYALAMRDEDVEVLILRDASAIQ